MESTDLSEHGYETPERTLEGWSGLVRVVDVYDGDTVQVVLEDHGTIIRVKCRMSGIDTCEIRSRSPRNREAAFDARDRLASLVLDRDAMEFRGSSRKAVRRALDETPSIVWARCGRSDKYGRTLIKLYARPADGEAPTPDDSFGAVLVRERLAYQYRGGRRLSESEQLEVLGRAS